MEVSLQKNKELTYLYVYIILIKVPGQTNRTKKKQVNLHINRVHHCHLIYATIVISNQ